MAGPYATLMQALAASQYMAGVSLAFGEEMITAQDQPLPYIVMAPRSGVTTDPGYALDGSGGSEPDPVTKPPYLDQNIDNLWDTKEQVQFYLWAIDPTNTTAANADAVKTLQLALLSALRDQRAQIDTNGNVYYGLQWKVLGFEWMRDANAISRYGRGMIQTIEIDIPLVMTPPTSGEVTVQTTQFNPTFNDQPG